MLAPSPYHTANLQSLLLAAQYHPLLAARATAPAVPPPPPMPQPSANLEMMEHLQRLLQFKKQAELQNAAAAAAMATEMQQQQQQQMIKNEEMAREEKIKAEKSIKAEEQRLLLLKMKTQEKEIDSKPIATTPKKDPVELKREEEMVEDEMKEEDSSVKKEEESSSSDKPPPPPQDFAQLLKQHLEASKLAMMKKILEEQQQQGAMNQDAADHVLKVFRQTTTDTVNSADNVNSSPLQIGKESSSSPIVPAGAGNCSNEMMIGDNADSVYSEPNDQDSQDGMVTTMMNSSGLSDQSLMGTDFSLFCRFIDL